MPLIFQDKEPGQQSQEQANYADKYRIDFAAEAKTAVGTGVCAPRASGTTEATCADASTDALACYKNKPKAQCGSGVTKVNKVEFAQEPVLGLELLAAPMVLWC